MNKKEFSETKTVVSDDGKTTITTSISGCTISDTNTVTSTTTVSTTTKTITSSDGKETTSVITIHN